MPVASRTSRRLVILAFALLFIMALGNLAGAQEVTVEVEQTSEETPARQVN